MKITTTHGPSCPVCSEAAANAEGFLRATGSRRASYGYDYGDAPDDRVHVAVVSREEDQ